MTMIQSSCLVAFLAMMATSSVNAFSSPVFQEQRIMQKTAPSKMEGVEIELPDFDELFDRIQQVSPLTKSAIEGRTGGFEEADANGKSSSSPCHDPSSKMIGWLPRVDPRPFECMIPNLFTTFFYIRCSYVDRFFGIEMDQYRNEQTKAGAPN
eukprot:scaffold62528_cov26-Attheya_sp.AAC.1